MVQIKSLAEFPENVLEDKLIDYFMYVYDYNISGSELTPSIDTKQLLSESSIVATKMSAEKKWWAYHLVLFQEYSNKCLMSYADKTIQLILNRLEDIEVGELSEYCNMFNSCMFSRIYEVLTVRPYHIYTTGAYSEALVLEMRIFIECFGQLCKIFESNFDEIDYNKDMNTQTFSVKNDHEEFITRHQMATEGFIAYINSVLFPTEDYNRENLKNKEIIRRIVDIYVSTIVKENVDGEEAIDQLTDIALKITKELLERGE